MASMAQDQTYEAIIRPDDQSSTQLMDDVNALSAAELMDVLDDANPLPADYGLYAIGRDLDAIRSETAEEEARPGSSKSELHDALLLGGLDEVTAQAMTHSICESAFDRNAHHPDLTAWAGQQYTEYHNLYLQKRAAIFAKSGLVDTGSIERFSEAEAGSALLAPVLFLGTYPVVGYGGLDDVSNYTMRILKTKGITAAVDSGHVHFIDLPTISTQRTEAAMTIPS